MIKKFLLLFFFCFLFAGNTAVAQNILSDSADLFSQQETANIQRKCDLISERYDTSVFIITTDKFQSPKDCKSYLKIQGEKTEAENNVIILLLNTKKKHIFCEVASFGKIHETITAKRCQTISSKITKQIENENYYDGVNSFCQQIMEKSETNPTLDLFLFQSFPQLILCLFLVSAGFCLFFYRKKQTKQNYTKYLDTTYSQPDSILDHFSHIEEKPQEEQKKEGPITERLKAKYEEYHTILIEIVETQKSDRERKRQKRE